MENKLNKLSVKQAYLKAYENFKELIGDHECTLEEAELIRNGKNWSITLGYKLSSSEGIVFFGKKQYKNFIIDAYTGEFVAMKIKEA